MPFGIGKALGSAAKFVGNQVASGSKKVTGVVEDHGAKIGTVAGTALGGPAGAAIGGSVGSLLQGGGSSSSTQQQQQQQPVNIGSSPSIAALPQSKLTGGASGNVAGVDFGFSFGDQPGIPPVWIAGGLGALLLVLLLQK